MTSNPYQNTQDLEVLSASPMELVLLLYRGALDGVDSAKRNLAAGDIRGRSKGISKACAILAELAHSLDHTCAPELSKQLALLYEYMHHQLCSANIEQTAEPLEEVRALLVTMLSGWQQVCVQSVQERDAA